MHTPWGDLSVADAHVHFFSRFFFSALAAQKKAPIESLGPVLAWDIPEDDPGLLADKWAGELHGAGVLKAALIASVPGDHLSVAAAVRKHPETFYGYAMVNPLSPESIGQTEAALQSGAIHGLCFFPAMHCYAIQDPRSLALIELAESKRGTVVFVHCGALSVGIRKKLGLPSLFDMRFSNPIDLHAVALRFPQIRFVIPHFGAGYFRETLMVCDICPNVFLDTSSSNQWMKYHEPALDLSAVFRRALHVVGPDRLLFGTDSSFFPRGWNRPVFDAQCTALFELGVDAQLAKKILHDNLIRLFE